MTPAFIRQASRGLVAMLLMVVVAGCASKLPVAVHDVDTYHMVEIGPVAYTLGDGFPVVEKGRTKVVHDVVSIPGTRLEISVDPNPPRDFRFDADAEKRIFLRSLPNANLTSAQYNEVEDWVRVVNDGIEEPIGEDSFERKVQQRMKINTRARPSDAPELTGVLIVLREKNRTATVRIIGNHSDAPALNRLADQVADAIYWKDSRRQPHTL
ncbi:MAG: hypothetical protein JJU11_13545 [Candidatus Sumerlaeia bacterium]|nr:hypothetical protein [Candidatus Sumerlaeia bacterium]